MLSFLIFFIGFALSTSQCNDRICESPTTFYTKEELRNLLPVPFLYNGFLTASGTIYINAGPVPGPPYWVLVAELTGAFEQHYEKCSGTLNGTFFLNISGVLVPVSPAAFNLDDRDQWTKRQSYCLTSNENVTGYARGDITADNFYYDTYIIDKAFGNKGSLNIGDAYQTEHFWFFNKNQSQMCVTEFNTSVPAQSTMSCFYFEKVSDEIKDIKEYAASIGLSVGKPVNDRHFVKIGKWRIPRSAIPKDKRHHFTFILDE